MSNVVYLPGWRQVSHEEMVLRMTRQDELNLFHIEFRQTYKDHLSPQEYIEHKESIHHKIRQSMTLVKK